jgi:hypothetical protein
MWPFLPGDCALVGEGGWCDVFHKEKRHAQRKEITRQQKSCNRHNLRHQLSESLGAALGVNEKM